MNKLKSNLIELNYLLFKVIRSRDCKQPQEINWSHSTILCFDLIMLSSCFMLSVSSLILITHFTLQYINIPLLIFARKWLSGWFMTFNYLRFIVSLFQNLCILFCNFLYTFRPSFIIFYSVIKILITWIKKLLMG